VAVNPNHGQGNFTGMYYRFIGADGSHHVVKCIGHLGVTDNGNEVNCGVLLFDGPVSSTVGPVSLLPDAATIKVPFLAWPNANYEQYTTCPYRTMPFIGCNYDKQAYSIDCYQLYGSAGLLYSDSGLFVESSWLPAWTAGQSYGDSGHPVFALIQNELVLQGVWQSPGTTGSCRPALVNAAIQALDVQILGSWTGDTVSVIDLSGFPDCPVCNGADLVNCLGTGDP
jgi:hypothetical protein